MNNFNKYLFPSSSNLPFVLAKHSELNSEYPQRGNHILACYNSETIILYQAVRESIAKYAVIHQGFKKDHPDFNHLTHLSVQWILRPGFLSMMGDTKWGTRDQEAECILALTVSKMGFECLLRAAAAMRGKSGAEAKVCWESDRGPIGEEDHEGRGVLRLHLRKGVLRRFLDEWLLKVHDVTPFVKKMRMKILMGLSEEKLLVPKEKCYVPIDGGIKEEIGMDEPLIQDGVKGDDGEGSAGDESEEEEGSELGSTEGSEDESEA